MKIMQGKVQKQPERGLPKSCSISQASEMWPNSFLKPSLIFLISRGNLTITSKSIIHFNIVKLKKIKQTRLSRATLEFQVKVVPSIVGLKGAFKYYIKGE